MSTPMKYHTYIITLCNCVFLRWLEHMNAAVVTDTLQGDETVSLSAYHASLQPPDAVPETSVAITCMLPLFYDQAKSMAMIRHSMDVVKKAVEILNPGSAHHHSGSTFVHCKTNPVELTSNTWRRPLHCDVRWASHWNGSAQDLGWPPGGERVDRSTRTSWSCHSWNCRFTPGSFPRDTHPSRL